MSLERPRLFSIIQAAGWPIWPLLLCSIAALAVVLERLSSLRVARVAPARLLDEVISVTRASLPAADVINKLAGNSVLGTVLATGLRAVIAEPRIAESALRGAFESAGRAAVHRLERYLNTLGTIASAAGKLARVTEITSSSRRGGATRAMRRLDKRSNTSASAAIEHRSRGQMGQPAACMIENNRGLSSDMQGFSGRAIMA